MPEHLSCLQDCVEGRQVGLQKLCQVLAMQSVNAFPAFLKELVLLLQICRQKEWMLVSAHTLFIPSKEVREILQTWSIQRPKPGC